MEEKENQLRNINQKGLVMKFEIMNEPRNSKSPSQRMGLKKSGSSGNKSKTGAPLVNEVSIILSFTLQVIRGKDIRQFNMNQQMVVQEVDPKLE